MISGAKPPAAPLRASVAVSMVSAVAAGKGRYSEAFLRALDWALALAPAARPQSLHAFSQKLYASHAGSLALHDALKAGEAESARGAAGSPDPLKRRALQLGRSVLRPAFWPLVVKMTMAMMLAALLPDANQLHRSLGVLPEQTQQRIAADKALCARPDRQRQHAAAGADPGQGQGAGKHDLSFHDVGRKRVCRLRAGQGARLGGGGDGIAARV